MKFQYYCVRLFLFPFAFFPQWLIHAIGRLLGLVAYWAIPKYRKRALSNLSLSDLNLSDKDLKKAACAAMQNLVITCLEFPKFARADMSKLITCENPELADEFIRSGKGIVFFCGHMSNWETLFLDGTRRMPGVAIGRPIKNPFLYKWVQSVRERYGGTIVEPKKAIGKGLKALRAGKFMGVVGDQGMPDAYPSQFLGRRAFTSPAPAMLAYKTDCPLMVATTRRERGHYFIRYSAPIWPDTSEPMEREVPRMMDEALAIYAEAIRNNPGEWLWQHNRWKQESPATVYYQFRHDTILIILKKEQLPIATTLRTIYPKAFLTFCIPEGSNLNIDEAEILTYKTPEETLLKDYRFKLILNLAEFPNVAKHYKKLAAIKVATLSDLADKKPKATLEETIERALCRPKKESHAT